MKGETYVITHVDRALATFIAQTMADPADALTRLLKDYDRPRRLGSVMTGSGFEHVTGDPLARQMTSIRIQEETLTCVYEPDDTVRWECGTLTLMAARAQIPETIKAAMTGKRLRAVIDAWWIPWNTTITRVESDGREIMLTCNDWIQTLAMTRLRIEKG